MGRLSLKARRGALFLSAGVVLTALAGGPAAAASNALAGGSAAAGTGPTLRLVSQPLWVTPGQPFPIKLAMGPTTGEAASDGAELEVSVFQRLVTRSAFALSQQGRSLGRGLWSDTTALSNGPGGSQAEMCIPVDALPSPLCSAPYGLKTGNVAGVYPIEVNVRDAHTGASEARLITHLVIVDPGHAANPLRFALVVPVASTSPLTSGGARRISSATLSRLNELVGGLAFHGPDALTLAPDPATLAALADTPLPAAHSVLTVLRRMSPGLQVLAQPFTPVNPAALVNAGLPTELATQMARGSAIDQAELGLRPSVATWLVQGPLDRSTVATMSGLGARRFLVPSADAGGRSARLTPDRPFPLALGQASYPALVGDPGLASDLQISDPLLAVHELLADLAQVYFENPNLEYYQNGLLVPEPRVVAAVAPSYWAPGKAALTELLGGLATGPFLQTTTLSGAFAVPTSTIPATPTGPPGPALRRPGIDAGRIRTLRTKLGALVGSLTRPLPVLVSASDLILASEGADLRPAQRRAYLTTASGQVNTVLSQVTVVASSITLTSRQGRIPLSIVSDLPVPARVRVELSSTRLGFSGSGGLDSVSKTFTLTLRNTTWLVPVTARSTGRFQMEVKVFTAAGGQQMSAAVLYITSRAFSGVGVILSVGALLLLAFWWARALQKGRRNRRLVERHE
ncbi:MAG: DUF6049 family protein [Acidimicrobiales bacterium]